MPADAGATQGSAVAGLGFDLDAMREKYRLERDKRIRPEQNEQFHLIEGEFSYFADDPYVPPGFDREPLHDEVDVAVIGAGLSGILAGARLREIGIERIRLIDKAGDVGGTWYWNRYPGAQCDVESYIYLPLLEETGYVPSRKYSFQPEILEHCQRIATVFDLYDLACFQTTVTEVSWSQGERVWTISTDRGDRMRARFVITANGPQSRPKLPGIPGISTFGGHTFHTSRWDYSYTGGDTTGALTGLADKRVGLIGTGATALQCTPHLGAAAGHLYVFERTPSVVAERNDRLTDPEWAARLEPGWQAERMMNFDMIIAGGAVEQDLVQDGWTDLYTKVVSLVPQGDDEVEIDVAGPEGTASARKAADPLEAEIADLIQMERIRARMDAEVTDPRTAESLKPYYRFFCKRPGFHDEYLPTFNRPNVTLIDTDGKGVDRVVANGVIVAGQLYELDCLIFATGFETGNAFTHQLGFDLIGRDGTSLTAKWSRGMRTFHGLQVNGFPNYFTLGLTQTGYGANYVHTVSKQIDHVVYIIRHCLEHNVRTVEATTEAEQLWVDEMLSRRAWNREFWDACTPSRFNNEGNLDGPYNALDRGYGGGPLKFWQILKRWRDDGRLAGLQLD
jgi:cyclohexanone monooxygenase